ncbi:hypothetical protein WR25_18477 [Diploscapter pachys]|uniref:Uncharacterized protein n=1 Tax=Diploscapter pachys TaxID=2018661 RepID=A0A2A2KMY2_9BILA|nr:hypothetical protein WR25_18477 [Diploscapter pachys]
MFAVRKKSHRTAPRCGAHRTANIPGFEVDEETDAALRVCTPIENGRVILEKSTREQIEQQIKILERFCNAMDIVVAECDHVGRINYYPLGELLRFHWELVELNETTCEQAKPAILRFDNMADYNMGRAANLKKIFGWGLWLVPLPTDTEDGMHYEIRYVDPNNTSRFKRVEIDNEDAAETER